MTNFRLLFKTVKASEGATVLMEFAAGLPFFMLTAFGSLELMNYINMHSIVSQVALSVADSTSRSLEDSMTPTPIRESDIKDAFAGAQLQQGSLNFSEHGRIIVSSLEGAADPSDANNVIQTVGWQRCWGGWTERRSEYKLERYPQGMGAGGNKIKAPLGGAVMFVEVYYQYQPILVDPTWLPESARILSYHAAYSVRDPRSYGTGVQSQAGVTPASSDCGKV